MAEVFPALVEYLPFTLQKCGSQRQTRYIRKKEKEQILQGGETEVKSRGQELLFALLAILSPPVE